MLQPMKPVPPILRDDHESGYRSKVQPPPPPDPRGESPLAIPDKDGQDPDSGERP
ncbi:MAG: hypothetical protein AB199_04075 [Parcubacteria bacterium C7867-004]|nr:MAG: hypothetical protein AB199_04075 [Parcubacteria bacterium C7867-004]